MPLISGARLGPYEVLSPVRSGGMGDVYAARDTRLERTVAIKVLPADDPVDQRARERFDREARAVARLNHPHICTLHDVGYEDGVPYLVLEYLEGETLADRLLRGPLPLEQALTTGIQICDALEIAHRAGIVHRDLTPANVMLVRNGEPGETPNVKLLDFGLAKAARGSSGSGPIQSFADVRTTVTLPLTAKGTILGTLPYMAPEQIEGQEADARADIFAFGAMLHEILTGQRAFEGLTPASVIAAILERHPPSPSVLQPLTPSALDHVVSGCLAKDPDARWQNAADIARELRWIARSDHSTAAVTRPGARTRERVWMAAALVLAASLAGVVILNRRPSTRIIPSRVQFTLSPPPGATWMASAPFSISPDGRHLAFVARRDDLHDNQLWIRSLDTDDARPLANTERALHPFWSPDGRYIGFFVKGQLKKVSLDSGFVQTLCGIAEGFGGTWNKDNIVLFATDEGLFRVSADGGTAVKLTKASRQDHLWPLFLPDGRRFLYTRKRPAELRVGSLESPEGRPVMNILSNVAYAAPGYLLYVRQRTLFARPFDLDRLEFTGEPRPITTDVAFTAYGSRSAFTVSANGTLVYRRNPPIDRELVWFDRSGARLGVVGDPAGYHDPLLSPNGRMLAFVRANAASGTTDIHLMDLARRAASRFTYEAQWADTPVWSRDGKRIAFTTRRETVNGLYVKAAGGGDEERIVQERSGISAGDWSPDRRVILYDVRHYTSDIWQVSLDGDRQPKRFQATEFNEKQPQFSRDGRWVAFASNKSDDRYEIYVRRFDGTGRTERISTTGGIRPRWPKDGREIFYLSPNQRLMAVEVHAGETFRAGVPRELFETHVPQDENRSEFTVTPDGQRFLLVSSTTGGRSLPLTVILNWPSGYERD